MCIGNLLNPAILPPHVMALLHALDRKSYREALAGSEWENVRIELSVKGNKDTMLVASQRYSCRPCSPWAASCGAVFAVAVKRN